ncbi:restriction endonuclease subunit S, partial [Idiomarina abyssalis]
VQVPEKKLQENLLQYGDILLNRTSETFDEIAMSSTYLDSAPATFGGFVIRGRDRKNKLLPNFSVYAFQSSLFRQQVIRLGQGAVRANIGQKDLSKVILPVPPKAEQKKIAQ